MARKSDKTFDVIMKLDGYEMPTSSFRNLLDNIHKGCYVEAASSKQSGTVDSIIRNKDGVPVCLKVKFGEEQSTDYISVDRVSFWEPYSHWEPDEQYMTTVDEWAEKIEEQGYHWDDNECAYVNAEGDELVW